MPPLNIAIQMDPPDVLNPAGDSTIVLLREAATRGHRLFYYRADTLSCHDGEVRAPLHPLQVETDAQAATWYTVEQPALRPLAEMDVVLMRQDPPFDMGYITATYLLDRLHPDTLVLNNPTGVRSHAEKLLPLDYPDFTPPTLISPAREEVLDFLAEHQDIILKPLYGWGGHAVLRLRQDGDNVQTLLEMLGRVDQLPWIAQPFLPQVHEQDIRVILINGEVIGAFARKPGSGEIRANMRVGGAPVARELSPAQRRLCEHLGPDLRDKGLYFAGVDLIGDYLTEINVTSPTGLKALETLYGHKPAAYFWDHVPG